MPLRFQLYVATAVAAVTVIAKLGPAFPAYGIQQMRSLAMVRIPPRSDNTSYADLPPEDQQAQIVLMGYLKMFGEPPHSCSIYDCESITMPGKYTDSNASDWFYKCSNTGKNGLTTSLVTATANGQTATGTYELDTMTEYGSLRQSINITTPLKATTTGDSSLETVTVVVLTGGVAWFLADVSGGAAAVAVLQPPENVEDHDDDKNCPNPEHGCSDCCGEDQICMTGADSGCACEATDCPADESVDQQESSYDDCDMQNGKCTGGHPEGFICARATCPDLTKYIFFCSECGGKDDQGRCKGDPTEDPPNLWQDCKCSDEPDWGSQSPPLVRSGAKKHQAALQALPDISMASPQPSSSPLPDASFGMSKVSNTPFSVFSPGVVSKLCNTINGSDKGEGLIQIVDSNGNGIPNKKYVISEGVTEKRTPSEDPDIYTGYTFALQWTGGNCSCNSDCETVYEAIASDICGRMGDQENMMTSEGSLNTDCGVYSYAIATPPGIKPTPVTKSTTLQCNTAASHKQFGRDAANIAIGKVCEDLHMGKVVLSQSGNSLPPTGKPLDDESQVSGKKIATDGATLVISPSWTLDGCEDPGNPTDLDFGAMGVDDCVSAFFIPVDSCGDLSNPNGDIFWKWGGTNAAQCAFWNVDAE